MFVVDLRDSFSFEDYHGFYFRSISAAGQHDCDSVLLVSCGADFDGFLAHVVDSPIWRHVEREWSFIHVSDDLHWVAVFFVAIDDETMKLDDFLLVIIWQALRKSRFLS